MFPFILLGLGYLISSSGGSGSSTNAASGQNSGGFGSNIRDSAVAAFGISNNIVTALGLGLIAVAGWLLFKRFGK